MLATFSPPIKATCDRDSLPRIVLAVATESLKLIDHVTFLAVDMNGRFEWLSSKELTVDWRYDPSSETWSDVGSQVLGEG